MSVRQLSLRFYDEIFNRDVPGAIDELVEPDAVMHGAGISERTVVGREALREQVDTLRQAFPDLHIEVEEVICAGNRSALLCAASGTHLGDALGVPATGQRAAIRGVSVCHWRDGRLAESWNHFDLLALYRQLGLLGLLAGTDAESR